MRVLSNGSSHFVEDYSEITSDYRRTSFRLSEFAGSWIQVRLSLYSDAFVNDAGLYLDDFAITGIGAATELLAPAEDPDGDGLDNRAEVASGTDPHDADSDDDGFGDGADNCPLAANPDQADRVHPNSVGDACDDPDHDGRPTRATTAPTTPFPGRKTPTATGWATAVTRTRRTICSWFPSHRHRASPGARWT